MAYSEVNSRLSQTLTHALEKIIKNGLWRKHSKLVHQCKSLLERLPLSSSSPLSSSESQSDVEASSSFPGILHNSGAHELSLVDFEFILTPFINALASGNVKIVEPAFD